MCNCLESNYIPLDPVKYGWKLQHQKLTPAWFEGNSLPTEEEYQEHLSTIETSNEDANQSSSENVSENDSDNDEYDEELNNHPLSDMLLLLF